MRIEAAANASLRLNLSGGIEVIHNRRARLTLTLGGKGEPEYVPTDQELMAIHIVRSMGAIPLFSTSWENAASQAVAKKLRLAQYGADYHVTCSLMRVAAPVFSRVERRKLRCAYRIGFAGGEDRFLQQAVGEEDRQPQRRRQACCARVIRRTV